MNTENEATLVVVDMQPFYAVVNNSDLLQAVERQILTAMASNRPVIVVEYVGAGLTHDLLMRQLKGYPRCATVQKHQNDGSAQVLEACRRHGFGTQIFQVCGIYAAACVQETAMGLASGLPGSTIQILADACNRQANGAPWAWSNLAVNVAVV